MPSRVESAVFVVGAFLALTWTGTAHAELVTEPSVKGYGIKGVTGATLSDMLGRCADARRGGFALAEGESPALFKARCDQLHRTLRNQPGNSARTAP